MHTLPNLETVSRTFKAIWVRDDEKLNQNNYSSNGAEGSKDIKEIELTELGQRLGVRNKEKKAKGNY